MKNWIGASFVVALVAPLIVTGEVPTIINYQGRMTDGTNLVNGTVGLEVRLFNVPSGGGSLYEDSNQVAVADGLYFTFIGDQTNSGNFAAALTSAEVYVETAVNGTTLTPRERLASVAYALRAGDSVQLGGLDATAYATGSPLYVESDPSWVSASTGIQQQLDAQASGLAAATTGLVQVEAEVDSLQSAVSVLASQVKRIEAGVTNMHEYGPTRFSVAFTPPFNQTPIVTVTPQLPGADAFVLASGTTGFVGMAGSTGYTVSASVINSYRDEGRHSSIAEISSRPAIAYYDATSNLLMYVRALTGNGLPGPSSWGAPVTVDQVAINASIIDRVSLLTVNGRPAIAYADAITRDIKYVRASNSVGSSWSAPVTVGNAGGGVGLAMEIVNGRPAIAFCTGEVGQVRLVYTRALDADGASWGTPVTVDPAVGMVQPALVVVNGNPALSYFNATSNDLRYVRALDVDGASWGAPVTVDSIGSVGSDHSLAVVSGHPAIAYYHATSNDLRYVRASDTNGAAWPAPLTVHSTNVVGRDPMLAVVKFNPAILYHDIGNKNLLYVSATDTNGVAWGTPTNIYSYYDGVSAATPAAPAMGLLNTTPVVSFYETLDQDLWFLAGNAGGTSWNEPFPVRLEFRDQLSMKTIGGVPTALAVSSAWQGQEYVAVFRASNALGDAWSAPILVFTNRAFSFDLSDVADVGGQPAFAITQTYQSGSNSLTYRRATNATATGWTAPTVIQFTTNYVDLDEPCVAEIAGRPAISFTRGSMNDDLYYARALDSTGLAWNVPVLVSASNGSANQVGLQNVLIEAGGLPFIVYVAQSGTPPITASKGLDADGSSWLSIWLPLYAGSSPKALVTGGKVSVASLSVITNIGRVLYYRAADAASTNGTTLFAGEASNSMGDGLSLAVVKGVPAATYLLGTQVRYVEAASEDAEGLQPWDSSFSIGTALEDSQTALLDAGGKALVLTAQGQGLTLLRILPAGVNVNWIAVEP